MTSACKFRVIIIVTRGMNRRNRNLISQHIGLVSMHSIRVHSISHSESHRTCFCVMLSVVLVPIITNKTGAQEEQELQQFLPSRTDSNRRRREGRRLRIGRSGRQCLGVVVYMNNRTLLSITCEWSLRHIIVTGLLWNDLVYALLCSS